ncbi:M23 family metallopeptidase [Sporosarcina limicola]|uniref:Murein DD-endopeptidase MepM/ murein hydrolase activator NlpD n=1 Tax=Sporosarcina limicola TaxID=34101 RepID=A0A927MJA2_9BACL|nr:M23 family metallopeptidase [Sporosarcina limicola]MBE1554182.1 murein DD-endopeptidase MepM/ murein hydrolase activator NlpD [Sporosarcina limicola]
MRHWFLLPTYLIILSLLFFSVVSAKEPPTKEVRMAYYLKFENLDVPWYYLAAIDQFESNIQQVRKDIPKKDGLVAIQFSKEYWSGALNPQKEDTFPESITFFDGRGLDGNGDGFANLADDEDVLFTMATYLSGYGPTEENFKLALWDYYKREDTVKQILSIAKLYEHFETLDLDTHAFPISAQNNYSYKGTWGANRGWGGRRIHEGTDLFAGYGVPVLATSYGVIEIMGWNEYGGWRIGIRDNHNTYHYFAHLAYFNKGIKEGDIVEPGAIIGYVGSSGYGKEGTSGRFPPHLHFGMYKYDGRTEWAFDPYPSLRLWERERDRKN